MPYSGQLSDILPMCSHLPSQTVDQLIGATRVMSHAAPRLTANGFGDLLGLDAEQTAGLLEFLSCLGLVTASGREIALSELGKRIARAGIAGRRRLFRDVALRLPVLRALVEQLASEASRSLTRNQLLDALGAQSCRLDADRVFDHMISWGRYAGLIVYDAETRRVSLPPHGR